MTPAGPDTAVRVGGPQQVLTATEVTAFVLAQLRGVEVEGRSVCVLVPDATRTCPMPLVLSAVHGSLHGRVSRLTVLVAPGRVRGVRQGRFGGCSATLAG